MRMAAAAATAAASISKAIVLFIVVQHFEIRNHYSALTYPQSNGQVEISNKIILDGIKKRLEDAKERWVQELPSVLWTYQTTP